MKYFLQCTSDLVLISKPCARSGRMVPFYFPVKNARNERSPSVLSPLLSNIVLDELDKELEMRGLCFVRYADDCVIFVRSERAGRRVMESVSHFIEKKLRLQVNQEKSAVGRPWERKYLGFCVTNSRSNPKIRIHWKTIKRFKDRVREITARRRGRSISQVIGELKQFMSGWTMSKGTFVPNVLKFFLAIASV